MPKTERKVEYFKYQLECRRRERISQKQAVESYLNYVKYVHRGRWFPGKHLVYTCNKIDDLINDRLYDEKGELTRVLIIRMPPQHGKSMTVTETLPSFYLGKFPTHRVIQISYNDTYAQRFARRNREKIKEFGKALFDIEISKAKDSNEEFELSNRIGAMISRGIMSGITGNPGELIIIDDPIKNKEEAESENNREKQWDEWLHSIKSRFSATGKLICIMTHWHEDDLSGRLEIYEDNVLTISFPCEAEDSDILGRIKGEALFPEIGKDTQWKDRFKGSYLKDPKGGYRAWLSLYQQRPTAIEGNVLKRVWWKYWKIRGTDLPPVTFKLADGTFYSIEAEELPDYWDEMAQSWDCAFKDEEQNDYVCGQVWGRRVQCYYLLDLVNDHMDLPDTMAAIEAFSIKWPKALRKFIEDKANGPAVIQLLRKKVPGLVAVNPAGGKEARVAAICPAIESGNVYIPHPLICTWVHPFLDQCAKFPNGTNDDMVDSTSQILNKFIYKSRDTKATEGITGSWFKSELIMRGLKEYEIRKLIKEGKIKLLG